MPLTEAFSWRQPRLSLPTTSWPFGSTEAACLATVDAMLRAIRTSLCCLLPGKARLVVTLVRNGLKSRQGWLVTVRRRAFSSKGEAPACPKTHGSLHSEGFFSHTDSSVSAGRGAADRTEVNTSLFGLLRADWSLQPTSRRPVYDSDFAFSGPGPCGRMGGRARL